MKRKTKSVPPPPEPKTRVFETFLRLGDWEIDDLTMKEPSCFNSKLEIRKYRITVELVEEPVEVLQARLQALWDADCNHHHFDVMQSAAKALGMPRLENMGSKAVKP